MKTKFSGEVGDRILDRARGARFSLGVLAPEVFFEFLKNLLQLAQESFILCKLFQAGLPRKLKHPDWIMIRPVPKFGIEMSE